MCSKKSVSELLVCGIINTLLRLRQSTAVNLAQVALLMKVASNYLCFSTRGVWQEFREFEDISLPMS
jgi:hypothetical protein